MQCPQCKRITIHSYTPGMTFDSGFWRCTECVDLRNSERHSNIFKRKHLVMIKKRGLIFVATLQDISSHGAKLEGCDGYRPGMICENEHVEFHANISTESILRNYIKSSVVWVNKTLFGIEFSRSLNGAEKLLVKHAS